MDKLIDDYPQVERVAIRLVKTFIEKPKSDKILINVTDQHNSNNIGGFNIQNFKMRYLNEFITDIVSDYE